MLIDIIKGGPDDPRHQAIFEPAILRIHQDPYFRVGRPRLNWSIITLKMLWNSVTRYSNKYRWDHFNGNNIHHVMLLYNTIETFHYLRWLPSWDGRP
eukprot:9838718-Prorocentrum_lima.AAC.1